MGYTLFIDGDNINQSYLPSVIKYIEDMHETIDSICLFGKLSSAYLDDWKANYPPGSLVTHYNIYEGHKNSTDMRILGRALSMYYQDNIRKLMILSSDRDMLTVVTELPRDVQIIVGYCPAKTAKDYLENLKQHKVTTVDLDALRGSLTDDQKANITNSVMRSYLRFKLGASFFSYKTVQEWIADRYPDLQALAVDNLVKDLQPITISFTQDGCVIN